jgi:DNA primase large subunit
MFRKSRQHVQLASTPDYPTSVNFYTQPPQSDLTMEQFESLALTRLKLLKEMEVIQLRNNDSHEAILKAADHHLPLYSNGHPNAHNDRWKDHVSHFILRLVYSRNSELTSWFVRHECTLFAARYDACLDKQHVLQSLSIQFTRVEHEERMRLLPVLSDTLRSIDTREHDEVWFKASAIIMD